MAKKYKYVVVGDYGVNKIVRRVPVKKRKKKKTNPSPATVSGWVKARAVKIVRNKRGQATAVKIKT